MLHLGRYARRLASTITVSEVFTKSNRKQVLSRGVTTRVEGFTEYALRKINKIKPYEWSLLSIPVFTFGLGVWQIQRRQWKLKLLEDVENRTRAEPIELPEDWTEIQNLEYCPVRVRGRFDHSKEIYIGPRSLFFKGDVATESTLISREANIQTGYNVITPFHLSDRDLTILVNRGWVPMKKRNPYGRKEGQIEGEVELVGLVRCNEERGPFMPKSRGNILLYRDMQKMCQRTDAAPIFLDADENSTVRGGPIGGQTRLSFRNDHLQYIVTWFGLSAATGYSWFIYFIRR